MEKIDKIYKPQNWKKRKKEKVVQGCIYVFTLNKVWKNL